MHPSKQFNYPQFVNLHNVDFTNRTKTNVRYRIIMSLNL